MGEAKKRGTFEERRDQSIIQRMKEEQEEALNPQRKQPQGRLLAKALAVAVAQASWRRQQ